ncbi:MAG: ribosomal protein methylthiotransferase RimO [Bacteroidota bacterium]|jgi:ribosomal protein S12 methylthiotransferase
MRTRSSAPRKVNVVTLGCAKNLYDSEVLMGQLRANAFDVEHEGTSGDAGIVIVNTCGFIEKAKQESIDTILSFAEAKSAGHLDRLYVTGCLSERYKDELSDGIPEVDAWFGTRDLPRLLKTLKADYKKELVGERLLTTPAHYAYLKIAEGCDRPCAFCAIPLMRGGHRSTPMEDLVAQAKSLAAQGVRELILIAQDLTYYGLDLYRERKLADLVRRLSDVEGIDWIRLHYAFPSGFPMDVLDVMAERSNVCKYLDMPLQHASDDILRAMRRGITQEKMEALIGNIRDRVPGIALRTTLICGFPGETDAHHADVLRWVERMQFDRLGCFTYSHEENTHAYQLADDVPEETKQARVDAIMELQSGISLALNSRRVGSEVQVLIDRAEGGEWIGRTEFDSPDVDNEVRIAMDGVHHLRVGDFVRLKIVGASEFDLTADWIPA